MHTIGVIADTHGLLAPKLFQALTGVTQILHAGDVGPGKKPGEKNRPDARSLLSELSKFAEVRAVRGNTDDGKIQDLPATLIHHAGSHRFFVHHGDLIPHGDDEAVLKALRPEGDWQPAGDIIVYGHTHKPRFERHASGVIFLNPGTAGGKSEYDRFGKRFPQQVAIVRCSDTAFDVSAIDLVTGEERAWAQGEDSPSPVPPKEPRKRSR